MRTKRIVNKTISLKTLKSESSDKIDYGLFTAGRNARNLLEVEGL